MAEVFELSAPVTCRPLEQWSTIAVELLGAQTRFVQGPRWRHRIIEDGVGGEPLILIHGIGGHAEAFARNVCNLAAHGFHAVAIDLLHHGLTDKEPYDDDTRIDLQAEAVADLISGLGWSKAHIEGESLGALVAFELGMKRPELCGKIVLNTGFALVNTKKKDFSTSNSPTGDDFEKLKELSTKAVTHPTREVVRQRLEWLMATPDRVTDELVDIRVRLYSMPDVQRSMRDIFYIGRDWVTPRYREEEEVAAFPHETLVFWTEFNPQQGPDYGEYVAGLIPGAKFYNMLDAAHWPQWEKPEEHDQVLIEFILGERARQVS